MSGTREENVYMARLAEQAERYEDMGHYMTSVANMGHDLVVEERNLLSVAFKNAVSARRIAWRSVVTMMKEENPQSPALEAINDYKLKVEAELTSKCHEILNLLTKADGLIATTQSHEGKVFYQKMQGDYYRYLAEFSLGDIQKSNAEAAYGAYNEAYALAATALPPTHPLRLGLALNFSVFYYEVYGQTEQACQLAKASYEAAFADMGSLPEDQYKDSEAILTLLRDNLTLWSGSKEGEGAAQQDGTCCEDL